MAICDEIKSLYVFEDHSFQMSKVYGGDRGICAMATAAVGYVCSDIIQCMTSVKKIFCDLILRVMSRI